MVRVRKAGACGLAAFVAVVLAGAVGCADRRPVRIPSPDGKHTLVASVNESRADLGKYLCLRIQIVDSEGKVRHDEQTGASYRLAWTARWVGPDQVELDSSDIGLLAWRMKAGGEWERSR